MLNDQSPPALDPQQQMPTKLRLKQQHAATTWNSGASGDLFDWLVAE